MTGEHSSKQYDNDLEAIRSKVLLMGGIVVYLGLLVVAFWLLRRLAADPEHFKAKTTEVNS